MQQIVPSFARNGQFRCAKLASRNEWIFAHRLRATGVWVTRRHSRAGERGSSPRFIPSMIALLALMPPFQGWDASLRSSVVKVRILPAVPTAVRDGSRSGISLVSKTEQRRSIRRQPAAASRSRSSAAASGYKSAADVLAWNQGAGGSSPSTQTTKPRGWRRLDGPPHARVRVARGHEVS